MAKRFFQETLTYFRSEAIANLGSTPDCKQRRLATAKVAPDGSFKIELPDFNNDPIASNASRELALCLRGIKEVPPFLVPESSPRNGFDFAASYPDEVIFVPIDSRGLSPLGALRVGVSRWELLLNPITLIFRPVSNAPDVK